MGGLKEGEQTLHRSSGTSLDARGGNLWPSIDTLVPTVKTGVSTLIDGDREHVSAQMPNTTELIALFARRYGQSRRFISIFLIVFLKQEYKKALKSLLTRRLMPSSFQLNVSNKISIPRHIYKKNFNNNCDI